VAGAGEQPRDFRDRVGELCVRGPTVTAGYWGDRVASAAAFADGWLHTGDVGSVDADGHVRLLDRLKDMIIRGGENSYSLEVESALAAHPDIAEVAVVGVPDPILDERVRAFVVLRPGATPTAEALRSHAATLLADFKIPAEFRFVDALPHMGQGRPSSAGSPPRPDTLLISGLRGDVSRCAHRKRPCLRNRRVLGRGG
jgi:acyl-CoA synthetase (AMP-forming)/AMP-acid ligase II